jgi:hypothetical protein
MDVGAEFLRNQSTYREVFIVFPGQLAAGLVGIRGRSRHGIGCRTSNLHLESIFAEIEGQSEPTSAYPPVGSINQG